ncbi:MAG: hypothetical protein JWN41_321 [Thermoleophilia bacterium]|nr:hypothetical protein [Thermoleophilia bacterium]
MSEPYSLRNLGLSPGQAKQETVHVDLAPYVQTAIEYTPDPGVEGTLDINAMIEGISLGLRFDADYRGPCARCLEPAVFHARTSSYELHDEGSTDEEMRSDFVDDAAQTLDIDAWAQEAVGLAFPTRVLCRRDCLGLCPVCGENQNETGVHEHEQPRDSRWDALKDLRLDDT